MDFYNVKGSPRSSMITNSFFVMELLPIALRGLSFGVSDSYLDIQKHQMTWLTKRLCDIADDQKDKCEKISNRGHERSTVQVELEKSFATGERRAIWRSTLTYDTFKNEDTFKMKLAFMMKNCWGLHGVNFWRFSVKLGWSSLFSCFITFPTRSFFQSS